MIDDKSNINRKSRAVSFDQSPVVVVVPVNAGAPTALSPSHRFERTIKDRNLGDGPVDDVTDGHSPDTDTGGSGLARDNNVGLNETNIIEDGIIGFDLMDIGLQSTSLVEHHFKPPRV